MYVDFTQFDQAIPPPWGMPAFELIDLIHPAGFFLDYDNFFSVDTPDFTGDRTSHYIQLRDTAKHIEYMTRAFPNVDETYFDQCPASFDKQILRSFQHKVNSEDGLKLVKSVEQFGQATVRPVESQS